MTALYVPDLAVLVRNQEVLSASQMADLLESETLASSVCCAMAKNRPASCTHHGDALASQATGALHSKVTGNDGTRGRARHARSRSNRGPSSSTKISLFISEIVEKVPLVCISTLATSAFL